MTRILHFSDLHVPAPLALFPLRSWLSKRSVGWANLRIRRGKRFLNAIDNLKDLARFAELHKVEVLLCTGDYTTLGTQVEMEWGRRAVDPLIKTGLPFITIPGNHDVYLKDSVKSQHFERLFGQFLISEFPEFESAEGWPKVRVLNDVAFFSINAARPNPLVWISTGRVPDAQLIGLRKALAAPQLTHKVKVIVIHYGVLRADGTLDKRFHRLENAQALVDICRASPRTIIVHGHIHDLFSLSFDGVPRVFCAGSFTEAKHESFWVFDLKADEAFATPGRIVDRRCELLGSERIQIF